MNNTNNHVQRNKIGDMSILRVINSIIYKIGNTYGINIEKTNIIKNSNVLTAVSTDTEK